MSAGQSALRFAMRRGWYRGVLEGNRAWTVVGAAALLFYLGGRALRREPDVVFCEELKRGETFRVRHEAAS